MSGSFTVSNSSGGGWDTSGFGQSNGYYANTVYTWPNNGYPTVGTYQSSGNWTVPTPTPFFVLCHPLMRPYAEIRYGEMLMIVEVDELPTDVCILIYEAASPTLVFV